MFVCVLTRLISFNSTHSTAKCNNSGFGDYPLPLPGLDRDHGLRGIGFKKSLKWYPQKNEKAPEEMLFHPRYNLDRLSIFAWTPNLNPCSLSSFRRGHAEPRAQNARSLLVINTSLKTVFGVLSNILKFGRLSLPSEHFSSQIRYHSYIQLSMNIPLRLQ